MQPLFLRRTQDRRSVVCRKNRPHTCIRDRRPSSKANLGSDQQALDSELGERPAGSRGLRGEEHPCKNKTNTAKSKGFCNDNEELIKLILSLPSIRITCNSVYKEVLCPGRIRIRYKHCNQRTKVSSRSFICICQSSVDRSRKYNDCT